MVAALMVANPIGDIVDPSTSRILAGAIDEDDSGSTRDGLVHRTLRNSVDSYRGGLPGSNAPTQNTIVGVVATNARLERSALSHVAVQAHDGLARAVRPAHTMFDGDTIFALSTGDLSACPHLVGVWAAEVTARAIANAAMAAPALPGLPSYDEIQGT